jgi:hypothetical protein
MKFNFMFYGILLLAVVYASEVDHAEGIASSLLNREREMEIQLGESLCPTIEDAFNGQVDCTCDVPIAFPVKNSFTDVSCLREICAPDIDTCFDITFGAKVTLGPVAISTSVCIDNIQVLDLSLPYMKLCVDYTLAANNSGKSSDIKGCSTKINGKKCSSCKPCDKSGGVKFDCSNIVPGFKSSKCTGFRPYLGEGSKPVATVPDL